VAKVLFVCKQNAGRSQMSDAFFQGSADGKHRSRSAGTQPAERVHPVVIEAMREIGVDLSGRRPQRLTDELAHWADVVVTMGCGDECPFIPGKTYIDWEIVDPAAKAVAEVRQIRDGIKTRVARLLNELG
jgi:arsenate reductase (thioredoxin)